MATFSLKPRGAFSLAQSALFLKGFTPASGTSAERDQALAVAFRLDRTFEPAAVVVEQEKSGVVRGEVFGTRRAADAEAQVARLLGLDADARGWDEVVEREAPLKKLIAQYPGFRPVSFASPYEAGIWGVLAQRISMRQAASYRKAIAAEHGDTVDVGGEPMHVFPAPAQVLALEGAAKLPAEKWTRVQAVARAAVEGLLDADRLKALPPEEALEQLSAIRGVGPWTSAHILLRGTGNTDFIALEEPRVIHSASWAYGAKKPLGKAELLEISERWRPFRTWAVVLMALAANRAGAWNGPKGRRR